MYFQFLTEDASTGALVDKLMEGLQKEHPDLEYKCKAFKGIGGYDKNKKPKDAKTGKILNDLTIYLNGYNKQLQGIEASIIVVVDNDDRDTDEFQTLLESIVTDNNLSVDHVFCIAIEEMEAWLLGDETAVLKAYPAAKKNIIHSYEQDSICGTWEILAEAVYPGGLNQLKKDCPTYYEIGENKIAWAANIGQYMTVQDNQSPSFQHFAKNLLQRIESGERQSNDESKKT